MGFHEVLRDTLAVGVRDPEVELRGCVSLVGRPSIPPDRLGLEPTDEDALRGNFSTSAYLYYPPRGSRRSVGC